MSAPPALQRLKATPANVRLGPLALIADGGARNYVLQVGEARFHGFIVRQGLAAFGYVDLCPHAGLPLAQRLDDYMSPDGALVICAWHGALFEPRSGLCVGGPCVGARLAPWPVKVEDGVLFTTVATP